MKPSYFFRHHLHVLWLFQEILICVHSVILPTIMINPWNPLFSCDPPLIHVRVNDKISFGCSPVNFHHYLANGNDMINKLYESMYFLDTDEDAYNTCNATGAYALIKCNPEKENESKVHSMTVRDRATGLGSIVMKEGHTYYFIDTAFRTLDKLDNLVGGSCNTTDKEGQNKIRLKVYVCSTDDVASGKCKQCHSEACFYKDCQKSCTAWNTISESIEDKTLLQTRNCTNFLLNENKTEYQTINTNEIYCENWVNISPKQTGGNCTYFQKRVCVNSKKLDVVQYREVTEKCDGVIPTATVTSTVEITGAPRTQDSDDSNKYIYVAIGASVGCFLVGLLLGVICQRRQRSVSTNNLEMNGNIPSKNGIENEGYDSTDFGKESP